ncbi:hypothetical protein [Nocardia callitridis]|uniref:hypothetical protein n=1 Tax=Nocardia callitridis TaxID=648753 RepID=UPI0031EE0A27
MIYEHPLAYLLGVEATALLRAFTGEHDRDFVQARIAEIRRLLADEEFGAGRGRGAGPRFGRGLPPALRRATTTSTTPTPPGPPRPDRQQW